MAKKKNSISKYTSLLAILLAIASACMIFCTSIVYKVSEKADPVNFTGLQVTFGYSSTKNFLEGITSAIKFEGTINYFAFSFLNLLPYILLLAGIVFAVLKVVGGKSNSKMFSFVAAVCLIAGGVLLFCVVPFSVAGTYEFLGKTIPTLEKQYMSLGIGAIVGGVLGILGGAVELADLVL